MSIYLNDIPLIDAKGLIEQNLKENGLFGILGNEIILLNEKAVGRVLAQPIFARISSPNYHSSAMDGFAVRSVDTNNATLTSPIQIRYDGNGEPQTTVYLDTGDPVPDWADAVIPIENVEPLENDGTNAKNPRKPYEIRIRTAIAPWKNIRPIGEDIMATELVLPSGHVLRPVDLGSIAACGYDSIEVTKQPKVAIIPTGTELVPIGKSPERGEIIEFNSIVLAGQVAEWGGIPQRFEIVEDDFEFIKSVVHKAAQSNDLILLNAGSSAGSEDFSANVVETLGRLVFHGVAARPGHPVIFGMIETQSQNGRKMIPIFGVPGYPVSATLTGEIFVEPIISLWLGKKSIEKPRIEAQITRKIFSPAGDDDYLRVAVGKVGEKYLAAPLSRGAGVITSLVRADGIVVIPAGSQGYPAGKKVKVQLYTKKEDLDQTIFMIGSHDVTLDLLAQYLSYKERRLSSTNAGSLGGLIALKRSEAHLSGSHLLDPESGQYNIDYIKKYLSGRSIKVVGYVNREQGLIIQKGNPMNIESLMDLARDDIRFVNRQRGAGTRILLDYHLDLLGLNPDEIKGYQHEEFTHLMVASAVGSGRADCALGIPAAAQALDLDFIPLFQEKYQLIIPSEFFSDDLLSPLLQTIEQNEFKDAVAKLPGYDVSEMGKIIAEIN
jgi:putative molybdopterin biosynthesis protein